jgi:cysteine-rich repeat protein
MICRMMILAMAVVLLAQCGPGVLSDPQSLSRVRAPVPTSLPLAETCGAELESLTPTEMTLLGDTSSLRDDYGHFSVTIGNPYFGRDGFIRTEMTVGERWHLQVTALDPAFDAAVYLLPGRRCPGPVRPVAVWDRCGPGGQEGFSHVVERTGGYIFGFDSYVFGGGGAFSLVASRSSCGTGGPPELFEPCEDGNLEGGDGCDSWCRLELNRPSVTEREPNDDVADANVLKWLAPMTVNGTLEGPCDADVFAVELSAGGEISAELRSLLGDCNPGEPLARLTLFGPDGRQLLGEAPAGGAAEACATIDPGLSSFARDLPGGTYYLRATDRRARTVPAGAAPGLPYQLILGPR